MRCWPKVEPDYKMAMSSPPKRRITNHLLKTLCVVGLCVFILWTALWLWTYYYVKTAFTAHSLSDTGAENSLHISGYPFAFYVALSDYRLQSQRISDHQSPHHILHNDDARTIDGNNGSLGDVLPRPTQESNLIVEGKKAIANWHILRPAQIQLRIWDKHTIRFAQTIHTPAQTIDIVAKGTENAASAFFGFDGIKRVNLDLQNILFQKRSIRESTIQLEAFQLTAFIPDSQQGDLSIAAKWDNINLPDSLVLPDAYKFLGQVLSNGHIEGEIGKFIPALAQGGDFVCGLSAVDGHLNFPLLRLDWGVIKPHFRVNLISNANRFNGTIAIKFTDTDAMFRAIKSVIPDTVNPEIVATVRAALINAEQKNMPFPIQIRDNYIRIFTQSVVPIIAC